MTQERKSQVKTKKFKKVDYLIMSNLLCPDCFKPLKHNSAMKGHKKCFCCFKISEGKETYFENNVKKNRYDQRERNRVKYNHPLKKT